MEIRQFELRPNLEGHVLALQPGNILNDDRPDLDEAPPDDAQWTEVRAS